MGKHPKPKSRSKHAHWSESQREQACDFYVSVEKQLYGDSFDPTEAHKAGPGSAGHPLWSAAWKSFSRSHLKVEQRLVETRRQYKAIVRSFLPEWCLGKSCRREGTEIKCPLSKLDLDMAVSALGTPMQDEDNQVYFETISECISRAADGDKLRELLERKRSESLHSHLVDQLKVLAYKHATSGMSCPAQPSGTVKSVLMLGLEP
jgi:hypothetical protein